MSKRGWKRQKRHVLAESWRSLDWELPGRPEHHRQKPVLTQCATLEYTNERIYNGLKNIPKKNMNTLNNVDPPNLATLGHYC